MRYAHPRYVKCLFINIHKQWNTLKITLIFTKNRKFICIACWLAGFCWGFLLASFPLGEIFEQIFVLFKSFLILLALLFKTFRNCKVTFLGLYHRRLLIYKSCMLFDYLHNLRLEFKYEVYNVELMLTQRQNKLRVSLNATVVLNLAGSLLPTLSNGLAMLEPLILTGVVSPICISLHSFVLPPYFLLQGYKYSNLAIYILCVSIYSYTFNVLYIRYVYSIYNRLIYI